jgi:hypothetical protein
MQGARLPRFEQGGYDPRTMSNTAAVPRRRSNEFARKRDARICWLLGMHPVTAAMLVRIGFFPSRNKALKRLSRLVAKRRIRLVGTVCRKAGRPEHVYCRWRPKQDHMLHEVQLTDLCLRIDAGRILRGPHVIDKQTLPDAEVWINGELYYLELDRGTMGYAQIGRRFAKYENSSRLVLWVCSTEDHMGGLRKRAERLRRIALFTTFAEALATPHGEVWRDYAGERAALPREEDKQPG